MYLSGWKKFFFTVLLLSSSGGIYCISANAASVLQFDRLKCQNEPEHQELIFLKIENNYKICQPNQKKVDISQVAQYPVFDMVFTQQMPLNMTEVELLIFPAIGESDFIFIDNHDFSQYLENLSPTNVEKLHTMFLNIPPTLVGKGVKGLGLVLAPYTVNSQSGNSRTSQVNNENPQLEGQPNELSPPNQKPIEQLLQSPVDYNERLERLRRRLQKTTQPNLQVQSRPELGLRVRKRALPQPIEQPPLPPVEKPVPEFKSIGSLQAYVGYFQSDNIFSSDILPTDDGLFFYGLRLASAYFPIGTRTYIHGSIDGNLIRYVDQARFNYNQLVLNLGIYQQLSRRMYSEIGWTNQQLFYARNSEVFQAGDRFLNENSLYFSLGRRDPLTDKLMFDSFYEFNWKLSDPENRSRIVNSLWFSLSYYLQKPLQVGLNYQLYLSDFSARDRHDQYHRLYGIIIYRLSNSSSLNFQTGYSFGDSTDRNLDFESWFLNISYNLKIGEF